LKVFGYLVSSGASELLKLLIKSVEQTETEIKDLIESPITAGKGFLKRAETETENYDKLVIKAQDKFTELIENRKLIVQSRALFFVAHCHKLLCNDIYAKKYFIDSLIKAMQAVEEAEKKVQKSLLDPNLRFGYGGGKFDGVTFNCQPGSFKKSNKTYYPIKDEYLKSLDEILGVKMPICSFFGSIINEPAIAQYNIFDCSDPKSFWGKRFGSKSPYFLEKERLIEKLRLNQKYGS
jgi:hypothetical protein